MINKDAKTLGELVPDMERYLQQDCYCPGEIYSFDGFFYQIFSVEDEIKLLGTIKSGLIYTNYEAAVAIATNKNESTQILMIALDTNENKIADICRVDATENNVTLVTELINQGSSELKFDEYKKGETAKSINEILKISNGLVICD